MILLDALIQDWNYFWGTLAVLAIIAAVFGVIAWAERKQKRRESGRKHP